MKNETKEKRTHNHEKFPCSIERLHYNTSRSKMQIEVKS